MNSSVIKGFPDESRSGRGFWLDLVDIFCYNNNNNRFYLRLMNEIERCMKDGSFIQFIKIDMFDGS